MLNLKVNRKKMIIIRVRRIIKILKVLNLTYKFFKFKVLRETDKKIFGEVYTKYLRDKLK